MKKTIWLIVMAVLSITVHSQGLKIGDKIKDTELNGMLHYKNGVGRLKDFGGKPLIIHFWFTRCTVCIHEFNTLNKLHKQYGDKVQFLLVTNDKMQDVKDVFEKIPAAKGMSDVAVVTGDTVLRKWFPHRTEPHEVWIDNNGVVKAITGGSDLTEDNVKAFVTKTGFELKEKKDMTDTRKYWAHDPIVADYYKDNSRALLSYSMLSGYIKDIGGFASAAIQEEETGMMTLKISNAPMYRLFSHAYLRTSLHPSLVLLPDTLGKYDFSSNEGLYTYDCHLATTKKEDVYQRMQRDLQDQFGVKSYVAKRKVKVLVLKRTSERDLIQTKEKGKKASTFYTDSTMELRNVFMVGLIDNMSRLPLCIIDETGFDPTGYSKRIDISLPVKITDVASVCRYLSKVDLTLEEEERDMEVIVVERK